MSILQIGARLVRKFGEGKSLKTVVTETLNGKTFTKVLDSNGNTVLDRVKKIDRYDVGNKKVSTITKVSKDEALLTRQVTDRVYDGESKLLGIRKTDFRDIGDDFVKTSTTKSSVAENRAIKKSFDGDGITTQRGLFTEVGSKYLYHNNKGLPAPWGVTPANMEDMKLAEMRRWHLEHKPDRAYAPAEFRLGYLDKQDEVLGTINNLDKFF